MGKTISLVALLLGIALFGCNKNNEENQDKTCLVSSDQVFDFDINYYYNSEHKIFKIQTQRDTNISTKEYFYQDGKIRMLVYRPSFPGDTVHYYYNEQGQCNEITKNLDSIHCLLSYNENNLLDTVSVYWGEKKRIVAVYEYDSRFNAILFKEFFVNNDGLLIPDGVKSFEYDTSPNWQNSGEPVGPDGQGSWPPYLSKNNVIKETYYMDGGNMIMIYEYDLFNSNGLPQKCTIKSEQGQVIGIHNIGYDCY